MTHIHEVRKKKAPSAEPEPKAAPTPSAGFDPAAARILKKYTLMNEDGTMREETIAEDNLGPGPVLSLDVINKFLQADPTSSRKYLDWMLLQAGGGKEAQERSVRKMEDIKRMAIDKMTSGKYANGLPTGQAPVSRARAETLWEQVRPKYERSFLVGDQDVIAKLEDHDGQTFGYFREWPGHDGIYQKIWEAVTKFQKNLTDKVGGSTKLSLLLDARRKAALPRNKPDGTVTPGVPFEPVQTEISEFKDVDDLEALNDEFHYLFKRQEAIKDIVFIGKREGNYVRGPAEKLYDDEYIVAYIPATAAAAIQKGYDRWCSHNRSRFDAAFAYGKDEHGQRKERTEPIWTNYTQSTGPFANFILKRETGDLHNIAAWMSRQQCGKPLKPPYSGVSFYSQENKVEDYAHYRNRLEPEDARVSFDKAMAEVAAWFDQHKPTDIKSSVYEAIVAALVASLIG